MFTDTTIVKRITIIGDGGVGKTTLVKTIQNDADKSDYCPTNIFRTPFIAFDALYIEKQKVLVYDVAGQDTPAHPLKILADICLQHTTLILLTFALDRFTSLRNLSTWYNLVKAYYDKNVLPFPNVLLVGTKSDLVDSIDTMLIQKIKEHVPEIVEFIPVSSLTGNGLAELKSKILDHI